jgi:hypothetical protein
MLFQYFLKLYVFYVFFFVSLIYYLNDGNKLLVPTFLHIINVLITMYTFMGVI